MGPHAVILYLSILQIGWSTVQDKPGSSFRVLQANTESNYLFSAFKGRIMNYLHARLLPVVGWCARGIFAVYVSIQFMSCHSNK